jgi:beta-lactamase class A
MLRHLLLLLPLATLPAQSLSDQLKVRIAGFPGTVSIYAKNLDTGAAVGIRESDPVRTASTIKLPIVLAVFDAVARGQAKWTDPLTVTPAEKVSGSGIIASELSDGVQLPLKDAANLMMVLSDNTATNLILERFGADSVNAYLDKLGLKSTRSMRKILGASAERRGVSEAGKLPENQKYGIGVSTPRDMVAILEKLERGEIVSPDPSKQILEIMRRCQDGNGIRRRFAGVKIVNKTGALDALRADVGIVYSPGGRIAMAITVDGIPKPDWSPDNPGLVMIADLAKAVVEGLARPAQDRTPAAQRPI